MTWYKKVLIGLVAVLALVVVLNWGLNLWIANRLPHLINEKNNSEYKITYSDLSISLISQNLVAHEVILVPKSSLDSKKDQPGFYANVKTIEVISFNIWEIVFGDKIIAKSLLITNPEITYLKEKTTADEERKEVKEEAKKPFKNIIFVSDVILKRGNFRMNELATNKKLFEANNLGFAMSEIMVSEQTLDRKLPFTYGKYLVTCDSLFFQQDEFYHLRANNVKATEKSLSMAAFAMTPDHSRKTFVKMIPAEKDQFRISAKSLDISKLKWGFARERFFLDAGAIVLDDVDANIYRSKMPVDDLTKKKLYNKLLRDISFDLSIDTLKIKNSRVVYEEEKDFSKGPGILTFNDFNMDVMNISSGKNHKKLPDVKIKVKCKFMNVAPLDIDWSFNVLDQSDGFNIQGRIFNFPAERISAFTKPYVNATIKGDLDEVYFNFSGNDKTVSGDFAINYDDLKVDIYKKKDRKKKNKFLTSIANLFVKNDTKEKVTSAEVSLERIQEKSFFNFLWRSIAEGLKKIMI